MNFTLRLVDARAAGPNLNDPVEGFVIVTRQRGEAR